MPDMLDLRLDQADRRDWAAAAGTEWTDAETLYRHMARDTHHVDAARRFPWKEVLSESAHVLELACGSGWLSGLLSRDPLVERVTAWDSSPALVSRVLPRTVALVDGDMSKIVRVCGEFTPLMLDDDSVDLAVLASGFHHCAEPDRLLSDLARVVKSTGAVVLLNEVPYGVGAMFRWIATTAIAATVNAVSDRVTLKKGGHLAADHILYDDALGDRAMTMAQWRRLFARHPFVVNCIDSGLPSYRPSYRRQGRSEHSLTHFLLRASDANGASSQVG